MKKLQLKTVHYQDYEIGFRQWLHSIGMSKTSQTCFPRYAREMMHWMEQLQITDIDQLTPELLRSYIRYLSTRPNQVRGGALSKNTINGHIQAIKKFSRYLWLVHRKHLMVTGKKLVVDDQQKITVLSHREVASLYEAARENPLLYPRDVVILDLFYGCGLRRSEGRLLDMDDVNFALRRLHVRHGNNNTERYVPFTKSIAHRLKVYLSQCRLDLVSHPGQRALLISQFGKRMCGNSLLNRLRCLQQLSEMESIHAKQIGLHTLRHTIATHLLHKGLSLSQISRFLGHTSIESTQIYTHLASDLSNEDSSQLDIEKKGGLSL